MFAGVDGCRAGWFAVLLDETDNWEVNLFPDIWALWNRYRNDTVILIDIPIGLPENGEDRKCDKKARQLLAPKRASSVFPAPCRAAVYADSYKKAKEINKQITGKRLSVQTWNIIPKIREVDMFLSANPNARSVIKESHPEVCFWALAAHPMKYPKKKSEGFAERSRVLQSVFYSTKSIVKRTLSNYPLSKVARDDILDALSLAVTARLGTQKGFIPIPETPEYDSHGLPMTIVYSLP